MKLTKRVQLVASSVLDSLSIKSRNLYNEANWYTRQEFFNLGMKLWYTDLYSMLRHHNAYIELQNLAGAHPPQQVLRQVESNTRQHLSVSLFNELQRNIRIKFARDAGRDEKKTRASRTICLSSM